MKTIFERIEEVGGPWEEVPGAGDRYGVLSRAFRSSARIKDEVMRAVAYWPRLSSVR
jgi:hypothetical protein